jgi:integrase
MARDGSLYVIGDTCYLKYYNIKADGTRSHKTVQLCKRSDKYDWWKKRGKWGFSSAIRELQREKMQEIRADEKQAEARRLAATQPPKPEETQMVAFWNDVYVPWLEEIVKVTGRPRRKPETVRGFKQIWGQHLSHHFARKTFGEYQPKDGRKFLASLVDTHRKNTIKHVKALASSIFSHAVDKDIISTNPWYEVSIPENAVEGPTTQHYTLAEARTIISALVDHVDAQLVIALACFLGLRPGEIAALKWEDFDFEEETVSIQRSVVRGIVGTPKTEESFAPLPLIPEVKIPLALWAKKCRKESESGELEGYVFESDQGTPIDLHNLTARVLRPHIEGPAYKVREKPAQCVRCGKVPKASGVAWKTLYAGRRGAATAIIESNNGNIHAGQGLLRHKNAATTLAFYKKSISSNALREAAQKMSLSAPKALAAGKSE